MRVCVTIPTLNSAKTLRSTLESVREQTFKDVGITIVDSYSTDGTPEIAREFTDNVINYRGKVLGARMEGFKHDQGDYHLILDSDQVLERTTLERCLQVSDRYDMLCLEERSLNPATWLERLYDADRTLLHKNMGSYIDSVTGVMCPRFYRSDILEKAFSNILPECMPEIHAYEDAIIFYEAFKHSSRVGLVKGSIWHREPKYLSELWRKNYRYGKDVRQMHELNCYQELVGKKERFRKFDRDEPVLSLKANLLLVLKGVPYKLGYTFGRKNG
ncbi:MAG: glycosyltransferase family 2 protein [Methanomassiliicoccus sp.]|nr:glycosyltransferase family 2 protein [Methanomassiliicoccus sp.]